MYWHKGNLLARAVPVAVLGVVCAGCGTLNQPSAVRDGTVAVGVATATVVSVPTGGETDVGQTGDIWLRYAASEPLETYVLASVPDLGIGLGLKYLVLGSSHVFDDHDPGLLLGADLRAGAWLRGLPATPGDDRAFDLQFSAPVGYAWSQLGLVYLSPSYRRGWLKGSSTTSELGATLGVSKNIAVGDVGLPPVAVEVYLGREFEFDATIALVRVGVQVPL